MVQHSKLGFGLRCIQQNEDAANVLGVNTYAYKTAAFSLSAVFVGMAGAIYANWTNYIEPPDVFDILLAVKPMVMVLLGGLGTIFGPAIGALILIAFEEFVWRNFLTIHAAALGLIIVVLVLFLPNGLLAAAARAARPPWRSRMTALLELDDVSRRFGGLNAVEGVSFSVAQGEILGLIGPNGAGKTTLINLITGVHPANRGRVRFDGQDITRKRPLPDRATRPRAHVPDRAAVPEDDGAGERRRRRAVLRRRAAASARPTPSRAEQLEFTGLADLANRPAAALTLARRKRLELAKSLAMKPRLLMLDEVNAGLNPAEIDEALDMIRKIASLGVTIIVIEHLMKVVLSISQPPGRAASWPIDRPGRAARGSERQERHRGLSRLEICGRQPGECVVTAAAPKLSVSRLQAGYGDVQVLWDVTLEVSAGELVCLIGSNGAGKTTLMRCISGLLPVTAGGIAVDGSTMATRRPPISSGPASPTSRKAAACSRP